MTGPAANMSGLLAKDAQQLATTVGKANDIVAAIKVINTLKAGFQSAAVKWRARITELETKVSTLEKEVSELRTEIQEARTIISPLDTTVGTFHSAMRNLVGNDGTGGDEMKAMIAEWNNMDFNADAQQNHRSRTDSTRNSHRPETPSGRSSSAITRVTPSSQRG